MRRTDRSQRPATATFAVVLAAALLLAAPPATGKPGKGPAELVAHFAEFNGTLQEGSSNGVLASIENLGGATKSAFVVRFDIDGVALGDAAMPAGFTGFGSPNAPQRWTATAGTHTLRVEVDATGDVRESDESNNVLLMTFDVQPAPPGGPDLLVQNGGFVDPVDQPGRFSRAWAVVENAGAATPQDAVLSFEVDGISLGSATVPAGYTGTQAFQSPYDYYSQPGTHTLRIVADAAGALDEADEANNAFTHAFTVQDGDTGVQSDLRIFYAAFDSNLQAGRSSGVYASIENVGEPIPQASSVRFHVDDAYLGDAPLEAGFDRSATVSPGQTWTATPGWHTLRAQIDPDGTVAESDETNNGFSWDFFVEDNSGRPDLVVNSAGPATEPREGQGVRMAAEVGNLGSPTTTPFEVAFYVDGFYQGSASVPAGMSGPVTVESSQAWTARAGSHTLRVSVDTQATVVEMYEDNNELTTGFEVADIVVNDFEVGDVYFNGSFTHGSTGRFFAQVRNWPEPSAVDTVVRFQVDGQSLGDAVVPAGFQNSLWVFSPQLWTATLGEHVLIVTVDADNRVEETREDNNMFLWRFTVTEQPPPPPEREVIFSWHSDPRVLEPTSTTTMAVAQDYLDVWYTLACPEASTLQVYVDDRLMATCVNGQAESLGAAPLLAGDHTFRVVFVGVGLATVEVSGMPAA